MAIGKATITIPAAQARAYSTCVATGPPTVSPRTESASEVTGLTVGGPVATHVLYALAWAAGIVLVAFPVAMRMYRRKL